MKFNLARKVTVGVIAGAAIYAGCDWTGGSDSDFNTSRTNLDATVTGFYSGMLDGGKAVSNPSGGTINSLLINQSGNVIEIQDSNNQNYRGTVGTPVTTSSADSDVISAGASLASYTLSWSGTDGVAQKEVEFNGVIEFITVTDTQGEVTDRQVTDSTSTSTVGASNTTSGNNSERVGVNTDNSDLTTVANNGSTSSTLNENGVESTTSINNQSQNGQSQDLVQVGNNGQETITTGNLNTTGFESSVSGNNTSSSGTSSDNNSVANTSLINNDTVTTTTTSGSTDSNTRNSNETNGDAGTVTTTRAFRLTAQNSQFLLRGNWVEQGGSVSRVEARSAGAGSLTTVQSSVANSAVAAEPADTNTGSTVGGAGTSASAGGGNQGSGANL